MGRSVSYPSGAIVAFTVLEVEAEDDWEFEYDWLRDDLRERAGRAFPSLIPHDGWRGREDRILMRNAYADFGVSVYGGLVAVWIVERDDGAYWDADWRTARSPRAQRWLSRSHPASMPCSATMTVSGICRTERASTPSERLEPSRGGAWMRHRAHPCQWICSDRPWPGAMRERPWASRQSCATRLGRARVGLRPLGSRPARASPPSQVSPDGCATLPECWP